MSVAEQKVTLAGYVGFDTITKQIEKKMVKRGFQFNIMLVGQTGLGKSTALNTLFSSHLVESKAPKKPNDSFRSTTEITTHSHLLEENGIKLKLNIVDTPGYGDQVNNDRCWDPIVRYIQEQYAQYLRKELIALREKNIEDTRIHCVLYFISPTGHSLKTLDVACLQRIGEICNVVPVIAKSDSLTIQERLEFKNRIKQEFEFHKIRTYPYRAEEVDALDHNEIQLNKAIRDMEPFAIVGSERNVVIEGKAVRGRRNAWGIVNVEDDNHCEFKQLRDFIMRTHLQDLIETTHLRHYEAFRSKQLLALKEQRDNSIAQQGQAKPPQ